VGFVVNFVRFWYDFIVGDDWTVAAGVVVAIALAALLTQVHLEVWWWMPLAVAILLAASLLRVARSAK
jgi:uncharacterized membrane protein